MGAESVVLPFFTAPHVSKGRGALLRCTTLLLRADLNLRWPNVYEERVVDRSTRFALCQVRNFIASQAAGCVASLPPFAPLPPPLPLPSSSSALLLELFISPPSFPPQY